MSSPSDLFHSVMASLVAILFPSPPLPTRKSHPQGGPLIKNVVTRLILSHLVEYTGICIFNVLGGQPGLNFFRKKLTPRSTSPLSHAPNHATGSIHFPFLRVEPRQYFLSTGKGGPQHRHIHPGNIRPHELPRHWGHLYRSP